MKIVSSFTKGDQLISEPYLFLEYRLLLPKLQSLEVVEHIAAAQVQ